VRPDGAVLQAAMPSDRQALANLRAALKRAEQEEPA
jgi:hypothetical protein